MTVWANKLKVVGSVIFRVTVLVIHLERHSVRVRINLPPTT
jgi:hypothetical protein